MAARFPFWLPPPTDLRLSRDEVHVWRAEINQPDAILQSLHQLLAPEERQRAEKFRFKKDRDQFIVSRGALRTIVGRYLKRDPVALLFDYNQYGKPVLAGIHADAGLCFNLSHSHGLTLLAVTYNRQLGIDLEYMREDLVWEEIADQFFTQREAAMLRALPVCRQVAGFFNCWTRKEAYIKAKGEGLSIPLSRFDVSLAPGEPAVFLRFSHDPQEVSFWSLRELKLDANYAAALVVEGHDWRLRQLQWAGENKD